MALNPTSNFPTSLDAIPNPNSTDKMNQNNIEHDLLHSFENNAIESTQTYVGITASADANSLTYKVTNASSSNPGHKHTLANGATDVTATASEVNRAAGVTPGTVSASKNVVVDANFTANALGVYAPAGFVVNGQIGRSVTSNNITVSLFTASGGNPSATDPAIIRIGNTLRLATSSTAITRNAGTNWFNSGSTELATQEVDYFLYAVWNTTPATDRVDIIMARVPDARTFADFSATTTDPLYGAVSGADTPASTDEVVLIGRFNATLSGTASFNWSVPATSVIINRPIYETRLLTWVPTLTGFSANPTNTIYSYRIVGNTVGALIGQSTNGTSNAVSFTVSMPMRAVTLSNYLIAFPCSGVDNGSGLASPARVTVSSGVTVFDFATTWAGAGWTAANGKRAFTPELFYRYR